MPVPCRIYRYGDVNIAGGVADRQIGNLDLVIVPPNTNVAGGVLPITPEGCLSSMAGYSSQDFARVAAFYMANVGQTDAGSGACSEWADLSGNSRNLTAAGAARPTIQADGSLLGDGFTDVKDNKLIYKERMKFNSGTYKIHIKQAVRQTGKVSGVVKLEGITDVGFRIEKIE
jgi:hypothetical protein